MLNMIGRIHSFESFGTMDGPGIRTVVFLQGCRFRCLYCHNPDTWDENAGIIMTVQDLLEQILRYKPYFEASGGGVTISGGEPLLQAGFVLELFRRLKEAGIHTCLDTSGFIPSNTETALLNDLIFNTDLVLLDVKHPDPFVHRRITGHGNSEPRRFAEMLKEHNTSVWLRYVVVPGYTDNADAIIALKKYAASFSNIEKVEYLPFHKMGEFKWEALGLPYELKNVQPPAPEFMLTLAGI
jgi:pyruvate formate lyase activating enzyme